MKYPAWLLALAFVTAVVAVVVLITQGHEEDVWQVLELVVPVLAALFVLDKVNRRSDDQDNKLTANHDKLLTIEKATNGDLTERLDAAVAPLRAEIEQLRTQVTIHVEETTGAAGQAYAAKHEE